MSEAQPQKSYKRVNVKKRIKRMTERMVEITEDLSTLMQILVENEDIERAKQVALAINGINIIIDLLEKFEQEL